MTKPETNPNAEMIETRKRHRVHDSHSGIPSAFDIPASSVPISVIATEAQLHELLDRLQPYGRIAIDTEADSLHCYREKLCLLQISIPEADFVVDPLAVQNLQPLTVALKHREIVLHGADFDLRL